MRIENKKIISFVIGGFLCLCVAIILTSNELEIETDVEVDHSFTLLPLTEFQKNEILDRIKEFPNGTQFSIALVQEDETQFIGIMREDDRVYSVNNSNSAFEIGSITKVFTATLLADLALSSDIAIDENINDYLPIQLNNNNQVTFLHLANHTSGVPRSPSNIGFFSRALPGSPYKFYDKGDLYDYLSNDLVIHSEAGEEFVYSNLGAGLLGATLSEIADQSYEELLQDRLLKPYKMENSTTKRDSLNVTLVQGLNKEGGRTINWDLDILAPAGGLLSTVDDLSQFVQAHFNPDNDLLAFTREQTSDKGLPVGYINLGMGLGWMILQRNDSDIWYWHNGLTNGYSSSMVINVEKRNGVIVLANASPFNGQGERVLRLSFSLMDSF